MLTSIKNYLFNAYLGINYGKLNCMTCKDFTYNISCQKTLCYYNFMSKNILEKVEIHLCLEIIKGLKKLNMCIVNNVITY